MVAEAASLKKSKQKSGQASNRPTPACRGCQHRAESPYKAWGLPNKVFREFASGCVRVFCYVTRTRIGNTTWGEGAARGFASG